jgi:hypothetical protein
MINFSKHTITKQDSILIERFQSGEGTRISIDQLGILGTSDHVESECIDEFSLENEKPET